MKDDILLGLKAPIEKISGTDFLLTAFNLKKLEKRRIVDLACGHKTVASYRRINAPCPRCFEMMKRSMSGNEDYDSFRKGLIQDTMHWKEDPFGRLHERDWNIIESQ